MPHQQLSQLPVSERRRLKREERDRLFPFHREVARIRKALKSIIDNDQQPKVDRVFELQMIAHEAAQMWQREVANLTPDELLDLVEKR